VAIPASGRFDDPVWDLRDIVGWVLDRDPAKFGRLHSVEDVQSAVSISRRYTGRSWPERDPNALRTILRALQRGDRALHDRDTVLPREYWGWQVERDLLNAIGRGFWGFRTDGLKVWSGRVPTRPPSRLKPFWSDAEAVAMVWLKDNGCPRPHDGNQAILEKFLADRLDEHGWDASPSAIRRHVVGCIER